MVRLVVRGALVRRLQFAAAAAAILIGVALVSGSVILAQSVRHTYDVLLQQVTAGTDVYVRGPETDIKQGISDFAAVPDSLRTDVGAVPGAASVQGQVIRHGQLVTPAGTFLGKPGDTYAYSWPADPQRSPFILVSGRAPEVAGEVTIDAATARSDGLNTGDPVLVSIDVASPRSARVVGLVRPKVGGDLTGAGAVFLPAPWAQQLLGLGTRWDLLEVAASSGTTPDVLRERVAGVLPSDGTSAITSRQYADAQSENLSRRSKSVTNTLIALSIFCVLIAMAIIFNTLGVLVTQRTRELALLRTIGMTRPQVAASVLGESAVVGLVASAIGALCGIPAAFALRALVSLGGDEVAGTQLVVRPATLAAALGLGTVFTLALAAIPAYRATRVPPIEALRDADTAPGQRRTWRSLIVGIVIAVAGGIGIVASRGFDPSPRLWVATAGGAAICLALALALPAIAGGPLRLLGGAAARTGAAGMVARRNALNNPYRAAAPARGLSVALAMVVAVSTAAGSAAASLTDLVRRSDRADLVISSDAAPGVDPETTSKVREAPGVAVVSLMGAESFTVDGRSDVVTALEPETQASVLALRTTAGTLATLGDGTVAVTQSAARAGGYRVGDVVRARFGEPQVYSLKVIGIVADNGITRDWIIPFNTYRVGYHNPTIRAAFVKARPGFSAEDVRRQVNAGVAGFPGISVSDAEAYAGLQARGVLRPVGLVDAMVVLAILVALLGVMNSLSISVIERTRDLGLLRVIGMTRRQLTLTVQWDAFMIVVLGAGLGLAVGIGLGLLVAPALSPGGLTEVVVPIGKLAVTWALVVVGGILAATLPAAGAARLGLRAAIS